MLRLHDRLRSQAYVICFLSAVVGTRNRWKVSVRFFAQSRPPVLGLCFESSDCRELASLGLGLKSGQERIPDSSLGQQFQ